MEIEAGDEIVIAACIYHEGIDIGSRLAKVISTQSYILVDVHDYNANPVKLMRSEVEDVIVKWSEIQKDLQQFSELFDDLGP